MRMFLRGIGSIAMVCLASAALVAQAEPPAPAGGTAKPASGPTTRPAGAPVPASQLLDSLLKPASASGQPLQPMRDTPVIDATSGKAAVAPGAPQLTLMREGSYIVDRVGRLTRSADGQTFELTFEADGKALKDPPMVIQPNQQLMKMENAVQGTNRDIRFRVTGMVSEYKGRNFILLDKVMVVPDVVQQF